MRLKKSIILKKHSSSKHKPTPDLDPTTNSSLHSHIWNKLKKKISIQSQRNQSESIEDMTRELYNDLFRLSLDSKLVDRSNERKFGEDIRRLIKLVCGAFLNPVYIPWDVEEYYSQHVKGKKDPNRVKFPNPQFGALSQPLTVVDSKGRIVLWYLPGLLSERHQSDVRHATLSIGPLLKESVKIDTSATNVPNWRINQENFVGKNTGQICEPGAINFSAGWFGQAHDSDVYPLLPSLNIRTKLNRGQSDWLKISNDFERFLNLTLSLIHPELFKCGLQILQKLRQLDTTMEIAKQWQSVYTGIAIISNRLTPSHRDSKGRAEWFDLLVNYAGSNARPKLSINDIGLDLQYSSGTVVGLCGTILKHEVGSWGIGDRVCYAHFMRESVRKRLDVPPAGWVYRDIYLPD